MDANKLTLNEAYKINRDVGGKICGQIDRSLSSLLRSMSLASTANKVDWNVYAMDDIQRDLLKNKFHENLPTFLVGAHPLVIDLVS